MARRTREDSEKIRKVLLKNALKVFSEKGYSATRLEDIATESNVTRGAIYWHFKNKNELFIELIKDQINSLFTVSSSALEQNMSPIGKLEHMMLQTIKKIITHPEIKQTQKLEFLIASDIKELQPIHRYLETREQELGRQIEEVVRAGQQEGQIRTDMNPSDICFFQLATLKGLASRLVREPHQTLKETWAQDMVSIFIDGIRKR
jgi:TetR/AcrR family acrAB operon transcriptional repressor